MTGAWRLNGNAEQGDWTGPIQKLSFLQINILSRSICIQVQHVSAPPLDRGLWLTATARRDRSHSAVRNEVENQGRPIAFRLLDAKHRFVIAAILISLEFNLVGYGVCSAGKAFGSSTA
jgi:hypothetical protein